MSNTDHPLSQNEFDDIYSKVPRLTVEIIVKDNDSIYLTKRAIEPCEGQWHMPGGTVRFGETLIAAVKRIAERELGIKVVEATNIGYIDYPSHFKNGLDSPIGIVFEVTSYLENININDESTESGWFKYIPKDMHADQDEFLVNNNYLGRE